MFNGFSKVLVEVKIRCQNYEYNLLDFMFPIKDQCGRNCITPPEY